MAKGHKGYKNKRTYKKKTKGIKGKAYRAKKNMKIGKLDCVNLCLNPKQLSAWPESVKTKLKFDVNGYYNTGSIGATGIYCLIGGNAPYVPLIAGFTSVNPVSDTWTTQQCFGLNTSTTLLDGAVSGTANSAWFDSFMYNQNTAPNSPYLKCFCISSKIKIKYSVQEAVVTSLPAAGAFTAQAMDTYNIGLAPYIDQKMQWDVVTDVNGNKVAMLGSKRLGPPINFRLLEQMDGASFKDITAGQTKTLSSRCYYPKLFGNTVEEYLADDNNASSPAINGSGFVESPLNLGAYIFKIAGNDQTAPQGLAVPINIRLTFECIFTGLVQQAGDLLD